uniref:Uncharacterized protein n=1 Tax=Hangzhou nora-like virus 2 TaxID=2905605 RepID=A0A8K1XVV5_9VIRU|nr:MAG: hypothetical protein FuNoV2_gp2 [Hangzhou nora-like virus 2]
MALKEEIFKQNSTLFEVLDENDITQISSINLKLNDVQDEVAANKLQLDGLAIIVDQNQARNESQFVSINTNFINLTTEVTNLESQVDQLGVRVNGVENDFAVLQQGVVNEIGELTVQVGELNTRVTSLSDSVITNSAAIVGLQRNLDNVQSNVQRLSQEQTRLSNDLVALKAKANTGLRVSPGDDVVVWFFQTGRFTSVAFDYAGHPFLRMGRRYTAQLSGFSSNLVGIYDVVIAPASTYQINATAIIPVPSGQKVWFAYKLPTQSLYTSVEVYLYTN